MPFDVFHEPHASGEPGRHHVRAEDRLVEVREPNPHRHPRLNPKGIPVRACRHLEGFQADQRDRGFHVGRFVLFVAVQVRAEGQPLAIQLLKRRGQDQGKPDNLVRHQLFFKRRSRLGAVIDDAGRIPAIIAVGGAVVAGVRVMEDLDRHALHRFRALHGGDIFKFIPGDGLQGALDDLAAIPPPVSLRVRKVFFGTNDRFGDRIG